MASNTKHTTEERHITSEHLNHHQGNHINTHAPHNPNSIQPTFKRKKQHTCINRKPATPTCHITSHPTHSNTTQHNPCLTFTRSITKHMPNATHHDLNKAPNGKRRQLFKPHTWGSKVLQHKSPNPCQINTSTPE